MSRIKKYIVPIVLFQAILLGVVVFIGINLSRKNAFSFRNLGDLKTEYAIWNDGWYVDSKMVGAHAVELLHGPYMHLPKGHYSLVVHYVCDYPQKCFPTVSYGGEGILRSGICLLDNHRNTMSSSFYCTKDADDFEIKFFFDGQGSFKIDSIELYSNFSGVKKSAFVLLCIWILIDAFALFEKSICNHKEEVLFVILLTIVASVPLFAAGMFEGDDIFFHLYRIQSIADGLLSGQFPVKIASEWFHGYGYPTSVFYGDILLYFPALLRIIGFELYAAYEIFVLFINFLSVLVAYLCFKNIFLKKSVSMLATIAYCLSNYRLIDVYSRSAVGEYCAFIFLPVIALAVINIYCKDEKENKHRNAFLLAIGMTGLFQSHILSTEMVVMVLTVLCIVLFKKTFTKTVLFVFLEAIGIFFLINCWFIVPLADYFINCPTNISTASKRPYVELIQPYGASILEYFNFSDSIFTDNELRSYNIGAALSVAVVLAGFDCYKKGKKADRRVRGLLAATVILLFLSSDLFPWEALKNIRIMHFFIQVQFPFRYLEIATLTATLLGGFILDDYTEKCQLITCKACYYSILFVVISSFCGLISGYNSSGHITRLYDSAQIDSVSAAMMCEYLPEGVNGGMINQLPSTPYYNDYSVADIIYENGTDISVWCKHTDEQIAITVPRLFYRGYRACDKNGKSLNCSKGNAGSISVLIPAGYEGEVTISYGELWYWRVAEAVSLVSVFFAIYFYFKKEDMQLTSNIQV